MERTQVNWTPKSTLRAGLFLLLGLGLSMLALYVGHAAAPTSGPTSFLGPDEAQASPSRYDIKYRHYTVRGTVYTRYGYHRSSGKGFGYRHIIGGKHGWYPTLITKTISRGSRAPQYEQWPSHIARVQWFRTGNVRIRYRVVYSVSREDTPGGGRKGVITAFRDRRVQDPLPCSVDPEQPVEGSEETVEPRC